jgi:hypothetical protein
MPVRLPKISNYTLWMIITLFPYTIQENYKALLLDILFYVFTSHFSVNCSSSIEQLSICISTCVFLFILYYRNTNSEKMGTYCYPRLCVRWTPQMTTMKAGNPTAATRPTDRSYSYLQVYKRLQSSCMVTTVSTGRCCINLLVPLYYSSTWWNVMLWYTYRTSWFSKPGLSLYICRPKNMCC